MLVLSIFLTIVFLGLVVVIYDIYELTENKRIFTILIAMISLIAILWYGYFNKI